MAEQTVAPGWYPDPSGSAGSLRWWDGQQWGEQVREAVGVAPEPAVEAAGAAPEPAVEAIGAAPEPADGIEPVEPAGAGPSKLKMLGRLMAMTLGAAVGVGIVIYFMGS